MDTITATTQPGSRASDQIRHRLKFLRETPAHAILIVVVVTSLLPFVWMAFASFKTYLDLANNPGWPNPWVLDNYVQIWLRGGFPQAILNSISVAAPRVIFGCLTSAAVGYVFAKYHFTGRDVLFTMIIATLMLPFAVILVPLYVTLADLGMVNNLYGLIMFGVFNTFGIFLLRQTIRGIPDELLEAARIDGAGEAWIFTRIILPLSGAPLAALAVVTFLGSWDDFLLPSIVLTDPGVKTLPLVLAGLRSLYWERYELFAAGSMLTVVPVMILYTILQKQFVRGIAMTGLNK
jgi:multiple sugar transport system permease protein